MPPSSRLAALAVLAACSDPDPVGPRLEVQTPVVAFGTVPCGTVAVRTVTLGNSGDEPVRVELAPSIATVVVAPAAATIDPGQEIELAVTARAQLEPGATEIAASGEIAITGAPAIPVTFVPRGLALTVPADPIDFGDVTRFSSALRTLSIFATGDGAATVSVRTTGLFRLTTPDTLVVPAGSSGRVLIELAGQSFPATLDENLNLAFAGDLCTASRVSVKLHGRLVP